jgi:hypothetical protein
LRVPDPVDGGAGQEGSNSPTITGLSPAISVRGAADGSTGPSGIGPEQHPKSIEVSISLPSSNSYSEVQRMGNARSVRPSGASPRRRPGVTGASGTASSSNRRNTRDGCPLPKPARRCCRVTIATVSGVGRPARTGGVRKCRAFGRTSAAGDVHRAADESHVRRRAARNGGASRRLLGNAITSPSVTPCTRRGVGASFTNERCVRDP